MLKLNKGVGNMGRPLGTKNTMRTPEEKERIVIEYLNNKQSLSMISSKYSIYISNLRRWVTQYRDNGIDGLRTNKKENNPNLGKHDRHPSEDDILKRKIVKLEIENARLKKGYLVKGVGEEKEFVTTFDVNTK